MNIYKQQYNILFIYVDKETFEIIKLLIILTVFSFHTNLENEKKGPEFVNFVIIHGIDN